MPSRVKGKRAHLVRTEKMKRLQKYFDARYERISNRASENLHLQILTEDKLQNLFVQEQKNPIEMSQADADVVCEKMQVVTTPSNSKINFLKRKHKKN